MRPGAYAIGALLALICASALASHASLPATAGPTQSAPTVVNALGDELIAADGSDAPPFDLQMQPALGASTDDATAVYHGLPGEEGRYDRTWVWNAVAQSWRELPFEPGIGERFGAAMAADPGDARAVLLYGGCVQSGGCPGPSFARADTWRFRDGRWSEVCGTCAPGVRVGHMMASNGEVTLLFGGIAETEFGLLATNDLWMFDGSDWMEIKPAGDLPSARFNGGFTWDGQRFVLFGGVPGVGVVGDTWTLAETDGEWRWRQVCDTDDCGPGGRALSGFAGLYRGAAQRDPDNGVLMVGGFGPDRDDAPVVNVSDVWWWSSERQGWTEIEVIAPPTESDRQTGVVYRPLAATIGGIDGAVVVAGRFLGIGRGYDSTTAQVTLPAPPPPTTTTLPPASTTTLPATTTTLPATTTVPTTPPTTIGPGHHLPATG